MEPAPQTPRAQKVARAINCYPGPVQCYNSGHNLPGATLHGPSLLDSRILGSCVAGDALHHVRVPLEALERAQLRRALPFADSPDRIPWYVNTDRLNLRLPGQLF